MHWLYHIPIMHWLYHVPMMHWLYFMSKQLNLTDLSFHAAAAAAAAGGAAVACVIRLLTLLVTNIFADAQRGPWSGDGVSRLECGYRRRQSYNSTRDFSGKWCVVRFTVRPLLC